MEEIYCEAISKIKQNKSRLERELKIKISIRGRRVCFSGKAIDEYLFSQVIDAVGLGFTVPQALILKNEDFIFEKVNIKDLTKRHDLKRIRGRLIGTYGKTRKNIEYLSDCLVSVHDNTIGIIGHSENIAKAITAITNIIHGSKQSKVYSYLERERKKERKKISQDLGLKE